MIPDQYTGLFGVIGYPVGHSLSPAMHNAAFSAGDINAVYLAFETRDLAGCMRAARAMNIRGMSITMPYKTEIIPMLDALDPTASGAGAVNTVVREQGRLVGYNTDGYGAFRALVDAGDPCGKTCLILGAGGAARAIGTVLKREGVQVSIANRARPRGEALARAIGCPFFPMAEIEKIRADIMIQTTPVGMVPHTGISPVPDDSFREGMLVMDVVYHPLETAFLKAARDRGCTVINGIGMFVYQGAEQYRLWTGLEPPIKEMNLAVHDALKPSKDEGGSKA